MIETLAELYAAIENETAREHRSTNVEFKEDWSQDAGKKISSNANKLGVPNSFVVIGVRNDGAVMGHQEKWARTTEEVICQHINLHLDPPQACTKLVPHRLSRGWIIAICVSNPGVVVKWNQKAYKSPGTSILEMEPDEIMEMTVQLPGLKDFSAQTGPVQFSHATVSSFLGRVSTRHPATDLAGLGQVAPDEALKRLRIGGRQTSHILFGDCQFRVVHFDAAGDVTLNETRKSLYNLLTEEFRAELQEVVCDSPSSDAAIPDRALGETLANAVAHAAYFEKDGDIIVEAKPGVLTVSNLCIRDCAYFANKWFSRSHYTLNNLLMETLRLGGLADELGRGKGVIFRDSILNGKHPPQVSIDKAGAYSRWRLMLHGGAANERQMRLLGRLREHYNDERKALVANALVLWHDLPVATIRQYVDDESKPVFAEVLRDYQGATFYNPQEDRLILRRWARILLGEGQDSKTLSAAEEEDLYEFARTLRTKYYKGFITPSELRKLAAMGETESERAQSGRILAKWVSEGRITPERRGLYKFPAQAPQMTPDLFASAAPTGTGLNVTVKLD